MTNPLIAPSTPPQPKNANEQFAQDVKGIGILESVNDVASLNDSSSWVESGLAVGGAAMEVVSMAVDPIGTLLSYGFSFLIEHVQPLKEALDWFAGDPDGVSAYGATWTNVSEATRKAAEQYDQAVRADTREWKGAAGDAYRKHGAEKGQALFGAADLAGTISSVVETMGMVVEFVREFVRDLVADVMARVITYLLEAVCTLGLGLPVVAAQASVAITKTVTKITEVVTKLTKTISNVSPKLQKLVEVFGDIMKALGKAGQGVGKGVRQATESATKAGRNLSDSLGSAAQKLTHGADGNPNALGKIADGLGGGLSDKVAEGAWKKFDDTFGTDVVGKHQAKFGGGPDVPSGGESATSDHSGGAPDGSSGRASTSDSGSTRDPGGTSGSDVGRSSDSGRTSPEARSSADSGGSSGSEMRSSADSGGASSSTGGGAHAGTSGSSDPGPASDRSSASEPPSASSARDSGSTDVGSGRSDAVHSGTSATPPETPGAGTSSSPSSVPGAPSGVVGGSTPSTGIAPDTPSVPAGTSASSVDAPVRPPETGSAPPSPATAAPRGDQPPAGGGAMGGGAPGGGATPGAAPSGSGPGRTGSGWTGTSGTPGATARPTPSGADVPRPGQRPGPAPEPPARPSRAHASERPGADRFGTTPHRSPAPHQQSGFGPGDGPGPRAAPRPEPELRGDAARSESDHSAPPRPQRSTAESMAAERPVDDLLGSRRDIGISGDPPELSPELTAKLGDDIENILPSGAGLSMIKPPEGVPLPEGGKCLRTPQPDAQRFTVEVHGGPNGVRLGDTDLTPQELAEVIKASPGYTPGEPVRLLSCRTGADLPDGSPNFAQQLSKQLGVEVLAPKTDAWVDNYGNMYASKDRATFADDGSGVAQPNFDEPGQWVSHAPDGTSAVHDSPFPPGHEPDWVRNGELADAAERRGIAPDDPGAPKEYRHPGGPRWGGMVTRADAYGAPVPGHVTPGCEFVPHATRDAYGNVTPLGQVDPQGRWVPGHVGDSGGLVPNGHFDHGDRWIAHGHADHNGRWIPAHFDGNQYHDLGRFHPQTHAWESFGTVDRNGRVEWSNSGQPEASRPAGTNPEPPPAPAPTVQPHPPGVAGHPRPPVPHGGLSQAAPAPPPRGGPQQAPPQRPSGPEMRQRPAMHDAPPQRPSGPGMPQRPTSPEAPPRPGGPQPQRADQHNAPPQQAAHPQGRHAHAQPQTRGPVPPEAPPLRAGGQPRGPVQPPREFPANTASPRPQTPGRDMPTGARPVRPDTPPSRTDLPQQPGPALRAHDATPARGTVPPEGAAPRHGQQPPASPPHSARHNPEPAPPRNEASPQRPADPPPARGDAPQRPKQDIGGGRARDAEPQWPDSTSGTLADGPSATADADLPKSDNATPGQSRTGVNETRPTSGDRDVPEKSAATDGEPRSEAVGARSDAWEAALERKAEDAVHQPKADGDDTSVNSHDGASDSDVAATEREPAQAGPGDGNYVGFELSKYEHSAEPELDAPEPHENSTIADRLGTSHISDTEVESRAAGREERAREIAEADFVMPQGSGRAGYVANREELDKFGDILERYGNNRPYRALPHDELIMIRMRNAVAMRGLSDVEISALHTYTRDGADGPAGGSCYQLNERLRRGAEPALPGTKEFESLPGEVEYKNVLTSALNKMRANLVDAGEMSPDPVSLGRNIGVPLGDLDSFARRYAKDSIVTEEGFTSCSPGTSDFHPKGYHPDTHALVRFTIHTPDGVLVKYVSGFEAENEALLVAGRSFRVENYADGDEDGARVIDVVLRSVD